MRRSTLVVVVGSVLAGTFLGACTAVPAGSPTGGPTAASASPSPSDDGGPFAGRTYRLDLPSDWIVLGDDVYDEGIDTTPDVAAWLRDLKLTGPNAIRAYEPRPGATGLRLAINPPLSWDSDASGPLSEGDFTALPGVSDQAGGDWVPIGAAGKGARFRWTQTIDWGSGSPTPRACVGYQVLTEFDPVNVVFTYPAETDRFDEVDALMTSFVVLGSPISTLPPGATPTPSPTPYDKEGSPAPVPTYHADAALEALLPDSVDGVPLTKDSRTGVQAGMTESDSILRVFGKHPADMTTATAMPSQPPLLIITVVKLSGVSGNDLLAAIVADIPDAQVSHVTLAGRDVTYIAAGAWPVWYAATGEYLYGVAAMDEAAAARVFTSLP